MKNDHVSSVKKSKNPFRFTSLFRSMVYMVLFSIAYAVGYIGFLQVSESLNSWLALFLGSLIVSVYGLALYFVCTMIWGKKRGTLSWKKSLSVWIVCLLLALFTSFVINPLAARGGQPLWLILGAILGLAAILFAIPSLILYFYAVYSDHEGIKAQFEAVVSYWKKAPMKIINLWLIVFLLIYLFDSFMGGPLYSSGGFDAPALFSSLLFLGEPGCYSMLLVMLGNGMVVSELTILTIMEALLLVFLSCNVISWYRQTIEAEPSQDSAGRPDRKTPDQKADLSAAGSTKSKRKR